QAFRSASRSPALMRWRLLALIGLGVTLAACSRPAANAPAGSDAKAVGIADQVMTALGGRKQWDSLHGLRWSFGAMVNDSVRSTRRHAWDKMTGRHRVDGVNRQGQSYTFIHTVGDTTQGMAWVNGNP